MATADKLNYLLETKNQIKNAIEGKGVSIEDTDSFRSYASKIGQIQGGGSEPSTDDWQPEPDWWDIETILENDTEDYSQKIICLLTDELDDGATRNTVKGATKYKLSDGQIIEKTANSELNISTLFDTTKDKVCSKGYKTRYIIYYSNAESMAITLPDNVIYTIFSGVKFSTKAFSSKKYLQSIKFINNTQYNSMSMSMFFYECSCLKKISNIDTSNVTDMSMVFYNCRSLKMIPSMNTNNATNMSGMFNGCYALEEIPSMNTNNVTNMSSMFSSCFLLKKILSINTNNVTNMSSMFNGCYCLVNIENITQIETSINLASPSYLTHSSLLKVLNALIDLSGQATQTLTLGTTNLAKLTNEEKAIATEKGWTLA